MDYEHLPAEQRDSTLALLMEKGLYKRCDDEGCSCEGKNFVPTDAGLWFVIEVLVTAFYDGLEHEDAETIKEVAIAEAHGILHGAGSQRVRMDLEEALADIEVPPEFLEES